MKLSALITSLSDIKDTSSQGQYLLGAANQIFHTLIIVLNSILRKKKNIVLQKIRHCLIDQ